MKSKIVNKLICILLFSSLVGILFAQSDNKLKQSSLINKEWVYRLSTRIYTINKFSDKEMTTISYFQSSTGLQTLESNNLYYLSDEIVDTFDKNKVGKTSSGKYIILLKLKVGNTLKEELGYWEILEFTENYLKVKNVFFNIDTQQPLGSSKILELRVE